MWAVSVMADASRRSGISARGWWEHACQGAMT